MSELPLLTNSRLKAFRACPRYHRLRYLDRIVPSRDADEVRFGTLWHHAQEAWWLARAGAATLSGAQAHDVALASAIEALGKHAGESDAFELAEARALMLAYAIRWADQPYDVLLVESEFRAPLVNPATGAASRTWQLAGKLDVLVRDRRDGRPYLVEHKTTSQDASEGSTYWRRLRMDGQISQYYVGAATLGFEVAGCIYDVVRRPGLRPLKATPPEKRKLTKDGRLYATQRDRDEDASDYFLRVTEAIADSAGASFVRGVVVRLEDEVREHLADTWALGRLMREAEIAGCHVRNVDACERYRRLCEYLPICEGSASADDPSLYRIGSTAHPELKETP